MTNEDKQALIDYCKEQVRLKTEHIARLEKHMPGQFDLTRYQMELQTAEIALAALTAKPVKLPDLSGLDQLAGKFLQNAISASGKVCEAYTECAHLLATEVKTIRTADHEVQE